MISTTEKRDDVISFDDFPWQGATVSAWGGALEVPFFPRDYQKELAFLVRAPDHSQRIVRFLHCYGSVFDFPSGALLPQTVRWARSRANDQGTVAVREHWGSRGAELSGLQRFELVMGSGACRIEVYALRCEIGRKSYHVPTHLGPPDRVDASWNMETETTVEMDKRSYFAKQFLDVALGEDEKPGFVGDRTTLYDVFAGDRSDLADRCSSQYGVELEEAHFHLPLWQLVDHVASIAYS